ncbi:dienelactone hydrolase family protein [Rhizoctonia solani]|uniref:Dienelactone hydrolase family protein n=1 Tax=Rhizoctonia solani TaxID=456999 RepID=A0A8H8NYD4_9AGAM|nr:dienelactone hydrolase family protein [Rhizoctonia solani]QRW21805.1 dienelactone hydrolase family protein [Rhizoctonia solani]
MSTIPGDNAACCTIPPVACNLVADYKPKGTFEAINGVSTYVIGNKLSKKAVLVAVDAFGMVPPTQQGCDILASKGFYVLMPDYLGDQALTEQDIPFDTPERIEKRNKLLSGVGNPQMRATELVKLGEKLKWIYGRQDAGLPVHGLTISQVGSVGYCWGGKLVMLAGANNAFSAVAGVHPSILMPEDAANCKAPIALYPTRDEDPADMEPFVKVAKDYKLYSNVHHGFAASRARLNDPHYKQRQVKYCMSEKGTN